MLGAARPLERCSRNATRAWFDLQGFGPPDTRSDPLHTSGRSRPQRSTPIQVRSHRAYTAAPGTVHMHRAFTASAMPTRACAVPSGGNRYLTVLSMAPSYFGCVALRILYWNEPGVVA